MTISFNWLKEYIDITTSPEGVGELITQTGLEVEHIEKKESVKGGLAGLVVGQVLTCGRHPNADRLTLTTVDVGDGKIRQIVCGAPNVAPGQKVIVALPGTTIHPINGEPITMKPSKIRGELSEGMICAEDEIGLGHNHDGILVLPADVAVGMPVSTYFNVQTDYVFEIGLTPNRTDAMSHIGVARDIRAVTHRELKLPSVEGFHGDPSIAGLDISVENTSACPRYSGLTLRGVKVAESPDWLKNRLVSIGLTPINNVVDVTNYVCHELGQPLHAFDADKIAGGKVIVKKLPEGSRFTTLDQKERALRSDDLMICDAQGGMCIAGVFGGIHSGITASTQTVFLESAYFSPDSIRRTSQHHGLKTDASFRFERGTDPSITVYALKRAALLLQEVTGGTPSGITDLYPQKVEPKTFVVKDRNVNRLIGQTIPREEIFGILKRLDIEVSQIEEGSFKVTVPTYRVDVLQEADIVEEILRIYGFNKIELSGSARTDFFSSFPKKNPDQYKRTIGEMLTASGFLEILTNSLTHPGYQQRNQVSLKGETIEVLNKLSEEQGILRQTLLFTGLEVCAHNINRKQNDLKLFEFGKIYSKGPGGFKEEIRLGIYMTGNRETGNWQRPPSPVTYFDMAQQVSHLLARTGVEGHRPEPVQDTLYDYAVGIVWKGKEIGRLGKVRQGILRDMGIRQEVFYGEFDADLLLKNSNPMLVSREVPRFPEVRRDLSLVIDKHVGYLEILDLILSTEKRLIREIVPFDVYEGEKVPQGKKAYALALTLWDEAKTLTDEEIDGVMQRLILAFEEKLGAVIRK